jgi:hypothetical protein
VVVIVTEPTWPIDMLLKAGGGLASMTLDLTALRRVAKAADRGGRPWVWQASEAEGRGGYPQHVLRDGDAALICETYDSPDHSAITPEFIATFDPPTVLALLDLARKGLAVSGQIHPPEAGR